MVKKYDVMDFEKKAFFSISRYFITKKTAVNIVQQKNLISTYLLLILL